MIPEEFGRNGDQRAFSNQEFLNTPKNTEVDDAQTLTKSRTQSYEAAFLEYIKFGREIGTVSLRRISMGLANPDLNEDGSIGPQGE